MNSYYGSFRTRTFANIFPSLEDFQTEYEALPFKDSALTDLTKVYYLLYSIYGNSHIAYTDETQFKFALFSTLWQYGPTWAKEVYIQEKLRGLEDEELQVGSKAIYNHAFNPSTAPSTKTLEELETINDQNTTNYKKSKLEGYSLLAELLKTDMTEKLLNRFKKLFIVVTAPDYPLYYVTEEENI